MSNKILFYKDAFNYTAKLEPEFECTRCGFICERVLVVSSTGNKFIDAPEKCRVTKTITTNSKHDCSYYKRCSRCKKVQGKNCYGWLPGEDLTDDSLGSICLDCKTDMQLRRNG